ncbi:hypothetical protein [Methylobacterium oxalidis]|uniref:Uncharacterized protein n=1 Tax=Methylobacterium oxalidis TaxID=944322 RepID=A0A512J3N1_9HYPH|nr:hypothetical protein [Methylobacterium oxalidis]GEP04459.1 hypothetical protein MOX02_24970 [Methylobacterium oxalidis]GLS62831.1 hypothetical protein GCM10007888_12120 [Methylobacterium oxalidis]
MTLIPGNRGRLGSAERIMEGSTRRYETALETAERQVAEAEQRRARQIKLIAGLEEGGEVQAQARQVLAEIDRTLAMALSYRSFLRSLEEL